MLTCYVVGWVPKAFVSSRSQRFDSSTRQKAEDFMDDEVADRNSLSFARLYCVRLLHFGSQFPHRPV